MSTEEESVDDAHQPSRRTTIIVFLVVAVTAIALTTFAMVKATEGLQRIGSELQQGENRFKERCAQAQGEYTPGYLIPPGTALPSRCVLPDGSTLGRVG